MKTILTGIAALTLLAAMAPAMAKGPTCLPSRNISSTTPQDDGAAILFHMNDGSVWRNDLRGRCPDLRFNGFRYTSADPSSSLCDNEQTITVLRSGEVCGLGKFTQVAPARRRDHRG